MRMENEEYCKEWSGKHASNTPAGKEELRCSLLSQGTEISVI
jgi:hypothetical protein